MSVRRQRVAVAAILLAGAAQADETAAPVVWEEEQYQAAEALRRAGRLPEAAAAYGRMVRAYPSGAHCPQALNHLMDIATGWLEDTFEQMRLSTAPGPGALLLQRGRFYRNLFHWDKSKPAFNEEAQALRLLTFVAATGPDGRHAAKALWLIGTVAYHREDYRRADECFSRLVAKGEDTPYLHQSASLAILSKLAIDDPATEAQRLAQARQMIESLVRNPKYMAAADPRSNVENYLPGIKRREAELARSKRR